MNNFKKVTRKALEIANKLGQPEYGDRYSKDEYLGQRYKFDELEIRAFEKSINIKMADNYVLHFNDKTNEVNFVDGKWTEVIDLLYEAIPSILEERKKNEENHNEKKEALIDLEESFKYYVECNNQKPAVQELIDDSLEIHKIKIKKEEGYSQIVSKTTGEYNYIPYTYFEVFDHDKSVAQFRGNPFNVLPNLDYYTKLFTPGGWE